MKLYQSFMSRLLLCIHFLFYQFPSFSSSSLNFLCHHDESSALLQFKSSFTLNTYSLYCGNTEPSHPKTTWKNGTDCCSWNGVTCDTISGHVVGLNLGCESIRGTLHPNSTVFHLRHLQSLDLSYINFLGSPFHFKFGGFLSLTHLDLSQCSLQGEVPLQISHLSKLESLHLSGNELVWKETTLKRLVQNATNLRDLFLDGTNMSSIKPNSMGFLFNQSSSLVTLNLGETQLRGNLKNRILCIPRIQELYMSYNHFLEGQLPDLSCSTSLRILDLSHCQFKGSIPLSFSNSTHLTSLILSENLFNRSIPSSFLNLQHLIHLDLSSNSFSGQIPDLFGRMTELEELLLDSNNLEGQIPSSLFTLTQLDTLDCSYNKLEGSLPNKITGFQKLTDLRLNDNLLNGTIPPSFLSLPSLVYLDLTNNRLTGFQKLTYLNLKDNLINGTIPSSLSSAPSLENLYLSNNQLIGHIPETIFNLANLRKLDLSSNNLSGLVHFQLFSKFENLRTLSLSDNCQLSLNFESNVNYKFPALWELYLSVLSLTEFPKLSGKVPNLDILDLSNNKINGSVPNWLHELGEGFSLFLNLSQNLFTSMEQFSRNCWHLNGLDLSYNLLEGHLPVSICNMSSPVLLNLAHNKLTGIIPQCLANLSSLEILDLQMNNLHGTLPSNFSKDNELSTLNLYGNQLEGHFPNCFPDQLEVLNLGNNKLKDKFPDWFQTLQNLKVLVLRDNMLHGPIANLKIKDPFPSLVIFDISGNNFSGPLPKNYLNKFEAMKNVAEVMENGKLLYMQTLVLGLLLNDVEYYNSVIVTMKGSNMKMLKIPAIFVSMDFSRNKFDGEIPKVIGELHDLIGLNLSHNRLTGHIPQSMGNLTNLEWLDLSSNMISGLIPSELTNLNFLEFLDLSNNHLVGEIPQGKQFNTFSDDSYEGNSGLCGLPLSKKCGPQPEQHHSPPSTNNFWSEEKFGFGWKPVAIGYGCGMVIGIGLGYFVFLIGKPRWLVMIFGGQPKRRLNRRRNRVRRTNGSTQMVQMS